MTQRPIAAAEHVLGGLTDADQTGPAFNVTLLSNFIEHNVSDGINFQTIPIIPLAGVKLVMVSNASYPALDPSGVQAVFSHTIVTGLLRDTLGFRGVVVTDALDAGAVAHVSNAPARARP